MARVYREGGVRFNHSEGVVARLAARQWQPIMQSMVGERSPGRGARRDLCNISLPWRCDIARIIGDGAAVRVAAVWLTMRSIPGGAWLGAVCAQRRASEACAR